jgi:hypothetical protein
MNANIMYTFAYESKRTTHSHEMTSTLRIFVQMNNKRVTHVQLLTFLKEKHYLDAC